jgi:hypothetical protein
MTTATAIEVLDAWKGPHQVGDRLTVREIGGRLDKDLVPVEGTAGFLVGERVLVFLSYKPSGNEYGLVGWVQGKFTLLPNGAGGWHVAKLHLPVTEWGQAFDAAKHTALPVRDFDLASFAARTKRVVAADTAAGIDWRDMPRYKGLGR